MKILLVHNYYQQKGGEDKVLNLEYNLLKTYGHNVKLFTVSNNDIKGFLARMKTAWQSAYSTKGKRMLAWEIRQFKPDVVHVHNFFPMLSPSIYDACKDVLVPVVQTLHNYRTICPGALLMCRAQICERCINGSAYKSILYRCYRGSILGTIAVARMVQFHRKKQTWHEKVDRFIALSNFARNKFIEGGFPANKIIVKPNFVKTNNSSKEYLVGEGESCKGEVLFVGRLSQEKGIATLLKAWQNLDIPLRIVGDGPLINEASEAGLKPVTILGEQTSGQVSNEMKQSRFLVMPSEGYEGFPMVLVEALAHGLPVVVSGLGSMAEIIDNGVTGLHFEPGNSYDLAEKVQWLYSHPDECKRMGENARSVYEEKYTPERNYEMLIRIYKEAIKENNYHATNNRYRHILSMRVDATSYDKTIKQIFEWIKVPGAKYICVSNVHMCMETYDDPSFRQVVKNADLIVPDGKPLVWALKLLGIKSATQVRGSDLLLALCREAQDQNISIGLYGGSPDNLRDFQRFFSNEFPSLNVACAISPPFRKLTTEEDMDYINQINVSGVRILFVGIGCPKQEIWMHEHKEKLSCVMIGVGAAFDFFSGHKKHAPKWMQKIGLEWIFRLSCEPRRLWKRYLKQNPRFLWLFAKQLLKHRIINKQ